MRLIYTLWYVIFNNKLPYQPSKVPNQARHSGKFLSLAIAIVCFVTLPKESFSAGSITTGTISGSPFCSGASITVPFTYSGGTFTTFTAQLSTPIGTFPGTSLSGSVASNGSGSQSITVTIPGSAATGAGYKIRIISGAILGSASVSFAINPNKWLGISTDWSS